jgi:putative glutamine amidotransferase
MKKPKIGIVLDRERGGDYSEYPYYVLREHYFNAVHKAGGIPVGIDLTTTAIADYVDLLDGLLMPGGDYDIPPSFYGDTTVHDTVVTKVERLEYDLAITQAFLEADKPILGICAGQQLLAVLYKGTLVQDIESQIPGAFNHYNSEREAISHDIVIKQGTLLHSIVKEERVGVNSHHHQAVKTVDEGMVISAVSNDGVVEAIEIPAKKFCLGVEWHPEFLNEEHDKKIFDAFIQAC